MVDDRKQVEVAHMILGKTLEEAAALAKPYGITSIRPTRVDGEYLALHENVDGGRLNVEVVGGVITDVSYVG